MSVEFRRSGFAEKSDLDLLVEFFEEALVRRDLPGLTFEEQDSLRFRLQNFADAIEREAREAARSYYAPGL